MSKKFASRGGEKLSFAVEQFNPDISGLTCADFGCNAGGFTDCLLQNGAKHVYAIDTGYGQLDWNLRKDPRVTVLERTNALYIDPPEKVSIVVIDVAWTPQRIIIPAAMKWLKPDGIIISLLKPIYEIVKLTGERPPACINAADCEMVIDAVTKQMEELNCPISACEPSPVKTKKANQEFLLLLKPS